MSGNKKMNNFEKFVNRNTRKEMEAQKIRKENDEIKKKQGFQILKNLYDEMWLDFLSTLAIHQFNKVIEMIGGSEGKEYGRQFINTWYTSLRNQIKKDADEVYGIGDDLKNSNQYGMSKFSYLKFNLTALAEVMDKIKQSIIEPSNIKIYSPSGKIIK